MNSPSAQPDPVAELSARLEAQSKRDDFDMFDDKEHQWLKPFPLLHEALAWLNQTVTLPWLKADVEAIKHQKRHVWLAHIAIAAGAGAIILAVVQLALKQSWPSLTGSAIGLEAIIVVAGVVSVIVGHWAKTDRNWLGYRHRAERLRMLKFRALARPELWCGRIEDWQRWVESEIASLPGTDDLDKIEDWSRQDTPEAPHCDAAKAEAPLETRQALVSYYRHKRVLNQGSYFKRKGEQAQMSAGVRMRRWRVHLFVVTIGCVLFHFIADWAATWAEHRGHPEWVRGLELASLWGVVLAAVLPVIGIGVRAWSAAFELSRKARAFAAKHEAMNKAAERLGNGDEALPVILGHIAHDELFLEQEHREWLRLLLDAEWFI